MSARIAPLAAADIDPVCRLARTIWQSTYPALISQAQIDFMLADRYAPATLQVQLENPLHAWRIAWVADQIAGFAHATMDGAHCKLDKLYVHPDSQRQDIGSALLAAIRDWARQHAARRLWLQVNRGNARAIAAYAKYGFRIVDSRVFDIGNGFVMDDYVMEQLQ
ncbi:MAG: GNAT family N-acetyltransferase [Thiobacillus sp.]|nr:GNAT family N-acetyltransferase [Thiobacillus sp.]